MILMVGAGRFERPTPCAQGRCATRLRYAPTCIHSILLPLHSARRPCPRAQNAASGTRFLPVTATSARNPTLTFLNSSASIQDNIKTAAPTQTRHKCNVSWQLGNGLAMTNSAFCLLHSCRIVSIRLSQSTPPAAAFKPSLYTGRQ